MSELESKPLRLICYNWMRDVCDWALDAPAEHYIAGGIAPPTGGKTLIGEQVEEGDIIFCKPEMIDRAFKTDHFPKIRNRFILISGIGSRTPRHFEYLLRSDKLVHWFTTNPPVNHPKISPLPIGFEEADRAGGNPQLLQQLHQNQTIFQSKKDRFLLPRHDTGTNQGRARLIAKLKTHPDVDYFDQKLAFADYVRLLDQYRYVLCLPGSGLDTHRNYETMLVGSIPIMITNPLQHMYRKWQIPGVFLKSWDDLMPVEQISALARLLRSVRGTTPIENLLSESESKLPNVSRFLDLASHKRLIESIRYAHFLR